MKFLSFFKRGIVITIAISLYTVSNSFAGDKNAKIAESYGNLPMSFELNQGQVDEKVDFIARSEGYNLFLTHNEAVLTLDDQVLRIQILNANQFSAVSGIEKQSGISNYFIGNDPAQWRSHIPHYKKVKYQQVYPGIDIIYYGNQRKLEYDFVVAPGADPENILIGFDGAEHITINKAGDLVLQLSENKEVIQKAPFIYQTIDGKEVKIEGHYVKKGKYKVGFEVGNYDTDQPLIIDPVVFYSTFLGGSGIDNGLRISVDNSGNAFIIGNTRSIDFPVTSGAFDITKAGPLTGSAANDIYVAKLSADGSSLIYATYLGGSKREIVPRIAIDNSGNAYISSFTLSTDFPTTPGVIRETPFPGTGGTLDDIIVAKLSPDGSSLVYSTYLGASGDEQPFAIAVEPSGNVCVTGQSNSASYPTTPGAFSTTKSTNFDGVVTRINADATAILYSTFLGGNGDNDTPMDIALDDSGRVYITGTINSTNFPTTTGALQTTNSGKFDLFMTILDPAGNGVNDLIYSTYFGGSLNDQGRGIAIDNSGDVYITGFTPSTDLPTTTGSFQPTYGGGANDGFVLKIHPGGNGANDLLYSSYLGGINNDA
ncbi:MAG: SBBP repeat-containing protein, partial [Bacteroidetes bacterium]|nr:SBBP repeat-containing protein [Bacteroidota bacterium]